MTTKKPMLPLLGALLVAAALPFGQANVYEDCLGNAGKASSNSNHDDRVRCEASAESELGELSNVKTTGGLGFCQTESEPNGLVLDCGKERLGTQDTSAQTASTGCVAVFGNLDPLGPNFPLETDSFDCAGLDCPESSGANTYLGFILVFAKDLFNGPSPNAGVYAIAKAEECIGHGLILSETMTGTDCDGPQVDELDASNRADEVVLLGIAPISFNSGCNDTAAGRGDAGIGLAFQTNNGVGVGGVIDMALVNDYDNSWDCHLEWITAAGVAGCIYI